MKLDLLRFLAIACLVGSAFALLDQDEIDALKAIRTHYPGIASSWSDSVLTNGCKYSYSSFSYGSCLQGHLSGINFGSFYSNTAAVGSLGNITGLRYLTSLTLGPYSKVPNLDDWYQQLPNLTTLDFSNNYNGLSPVFTANFTENPNLVTLSYSDVVGSNIPDISGASALRSLTISVPKATTISMDYLQELNLTSLSFESTGTGSPRIKTFPGFGHLTYLQTLSFASSYIEVLQDNFTNLVRLETFNCDSCSQLTHLAPSMSNCVALKTVSCYACRLNQADSLPDFSDTKLSQLLLRSNSITTVWPDGLCQLSTAPTAPGLVLGLEYNSLVDIPACFASTVGLYQISFASPAFTSFPSSLASMATLQTLSIVGAASMTGGIPDISAMTALTSLEIRNCALDGAFPPSFPLSIRYIYLQNNKMSGNVADSIFTGLTQLQYLTISNNQFSGPFPTSINRATVLSYLEAANNHFTSLPSTIGENQYLYYINFNNNSLSSIPSDASFRNMTSLRTLYLNSNRNLNGPLPTFWAERYPYVYQVDLSGCSFTGGVPQINSTTLSTLYLSDNALAGSIGNVILGSNMRYFRVDRNLLTGNIPASIGTLITGFLGIREFDVSYNRLTGSIPPSFGNILGDLETFAFNNNGISGLLPNLALANDLEVIRGHNTNVRLCDVNPGIPYVSECSLYDVAGFGSCGCESWYSRCTTNTTCPSPDYVYEPESSAPYDAPTPVGPPTTPTSQTPSSPSLAVIDPNAPVAASATLSANLTIALLCFVAAMLM